jgi:Tol biopolymer transport system component
MSKERETTIAAIVATVFPCIVIGLCVPIVRSSVGIYAPAFAARPIVAIEAQSPLSSATPPAVPSTVAGTDSALDLRLVFYGYPKIGVPRSGAAIIGESGLSDVHDITFSLIGGELSPDGRFIAYDSCSSTNRGIYLAEADGSKAQMIKDLNGSPCVDIRWSPDSAKLSYTSRQDSSLHIFDIARKSDTLIPNTQGADLHWWSPTGDEIVYGRMRRSDSNRPIGRLLYITDLRGNSRQLTFDKDFAPCERERNIIDTWAPAWSPTGNTIAFTECECLFVISPTGNDLKQLTTPLYASRPSPEMPVTPAYSPRWSPDGRWIFFIGEGAVRRVGDGAVLKRVSPDGKTIVEIGKLPYGGGPFSIAPFIK